MKDKGRKCRAVYDAPRPAFDDQRASMTKCGTVNGVPVHVVRNGGIYGGFVEVTGMCVAHKREVSTYNLTLHGRKFRAALSTKAGNMLYFMSATPESQRPQTFAHPALAMAIVVWLGPDCAAEYTAMMRAYVNSGFERLNEQLRNAEARARLTTTDSIGTRLDAVCSKLDSVVAVTAETGKTVATAVEQLAELRTGTAGEPVTQFTPLIRPLIRATDLAIETREVAEPVTPGTVPAAVSVRDYISIKVSEYAQLYGGGDYEAAYDTMYDLFVSLYPWAHSLLAAARDSRAQRKSSILGYIATAEECATDVGVPERYRTPLQDLKKVCDSLFGPRGTMVSEAKKRARGMQLGAH